MNVHARYGNNDSSKKDSIARRIPVYGAPKQLRKENRAPMVIGVPQSLREKIGVQVGGKVIVRNSNLNRTTELTVCRTDNRLLSAIPFLNNNPKAHACLPPTVREMLALTQVDYRNRSVCFNKVFSTIDIDKKIFSFPDEELVHESIFQSAGEQTDVVRHYVPMSFSRWIISLN